MATNPLGAVALVVGATFIVGMFVGVVLMLESAIVHRRGSTVAARLLLSGPPGGLLAAALYFSVFDALPIVFRLLIIIVYLVTAIPVFVWLLRAKIRFAPSGRAQS